MPSELPDGWSSVRLDQVAELCLGKMLDKEKNRGGPRPYLANMNVRWGSFDLHDLREMPFEEREVDRYGLRFGDIVMCEGGEPGRCAIWLDEVPGMMIQKALHRIRPKKGIDGHYLCYTLAHGVHSGTFDEYMTGSGIKHLPGNQVAKLEVSIPPFDEQRRIAEVLRSVDDSILAKQAALTASKQFKRSCREAAVQRFQQSPPSALQAVLSSIDAGWSPDCDSEPADDGEWSILKTSSVVWEGYNDSENKRLPSRFEVRPNLEVAADDILITRAGPAERTGVVAIVRETSGRRMLSDKIIRLRVSPEKAVPLAIAELLSSDHVQAELVRSKTGMAASQTNISQKIVLGLEMNLPSLVDQNDFASEMAALQDVIERNDDDLRMTMLLKAALMSDLLSGHVRVPA